MRLIVTRPEPDATRTAEALARLGHEPILSPMLDIVPDATTAIPERDYQAVLATSTNAVRALDAHPDPLRLHGRLLFAVGDHTALHAKRAGFAARSAGGAVDDLVARIASELSPEAGPLIYAAGDVQAGDLAGRLRALGFEVDVAIVYRAEPHTRLAPAAAVALRRRHVDGVLLYSPRSAAAFAQALKAEDLAPLAPHIACFCLSTAVAEALGRITSGEILVAERPDQLSLFALVERRSALAAKNGA